MPSIRWKPLPALSLPSAPQQPPSPDQRSPCTYPWASPASPSSFWKPLLLTFPGGLLLPFLAERLWCRDATYCSQEGRPAGCNCRMIPPPPGAWGEGMGKTSKQPHLVALLWSRCWERCPTKAPPLSLVPYGIFLPHRALLKCPKFTYSFLLFLFNYCQPFKLGLGLPLLTSTFLKAAVSSSPRLQCKASTL